LPAHLVERIHDRIAGDKYNAHPLSSPVDTTVTDLAQRTGTMGYQVLAREGIRRQDGRLLLPQEAIKTQPAERFTPADLMQYWNPQWRLERAAYTSVHGGTYLESDDVLATFPRDESMGVVISRKVRLGERPVLTLQVAADAGREWRLAVYVNNKRVHNRSVKGATPRTWQEISLSLDGFAGQEVTLRLYQDVRTPEPGNAYWKALRLEP